MVGADGDRLRNDSSGLVGASLVGFNESRERGDVFTGRLGNGLPGASLTGIGGKTFSISLTVSFFKTELCLIPSLITSNEGEQSVAINGFLSGIVGSFGISDVRHLFMFLFSTFFSLSKEFSSTVLFLALLWNDSLSGIGGGGR